MSGRTLIVRWLGRSEYVPVWQAMKVFTAGRSQDTVDEFWVVEHFPVFTQGLNGKPQHLLDPGHIPVVHIDRGGQVTYHGPGQVVIYLLLDLRRLAIGVRRLVNHIEQAVIGFLTEQGVNAHANLRAPGVYVQGRKIAALGLKVTRGCSYHGLAFNAAMDVAPFARINPCGYPGLEIIQLKDLGVNMNWEAVAQNLCAHLQQQLGYGPDIKRNYQAYVEHTSQSGSGD
jgi:lipoyl(octanoyl) transferase